MKKSGRILSLILVLVMLIGVLPTSALAATPWAYVRDANGKVTPYSSFPAAWDAAMKLNNVTVGLYDNWKSGRFVVPKNKNVTLELNGFWISRELTSSESEGEVFRVEEYATLTVYGGSKANPSEGSTKDHNMWVYVPKENGKPERRQVKLYGGIINGGNSSNGGGGIYMEEGARVNLYNVTVAGNKADSNAANDGDGGGVFMNDDYGYLYMEDSQICYNFAEWDGGGVYVADGAPYCTIEMKNSHIHHNSCDDNGAGIEVDSENFKLIGDAQQLQCTEEELEALMANYPDFRSCMSTSVDFSKFNGSSVSYNYVYDSQYGGAGIFLEEDTALISGVNIVGNNADNASSAHECGGGGIYINYEGVTVRNCNILRNRSDEYGAGIYVNNDETAVDSCTFFWNVAGKRGGGIYTISSVDLAVKGSLIVTKNTSNTYSNDNLYLNAYGANDAYVIPGLGPGANVHIRLDGSHDMQVSNEAGTYNERYFFYDNDSSKHIKWDSDRYLRVVSGAKPVQATEVFQPDAGKRTQTTDKTYNGYPVIRGVFRYPNVKNDDADLESIFYYSDGFFAGSPSTYDPHLATASLCLAGAAGYSNAYGKVSEGSSLGDRNDYLDKSKNFRQFVSDIGCKDADIFVNDFNAQKPTAATIGVGIASKDLPDGRKLVIIGVRGMGYEAEWTSNMTLGAEGEAEGWSTAADQVFAELKNYLSRKGIDGASENTVFWIAGYSRAGATSNLTARRIIDAFDNQGTHTFAYPLEAPMGGLESVKTAGNNYNCIHNVVNQNDIVPWVGTTEMGFIRYGTDHYNPGSAETHAPADGSDNNKIPEDNAAWNVGSGDYNSQKTKMLAQLNAISSDIVFDDYFHVATIDYIINRGIKETDDYDWTTERYIELFFKYLQETALNFGDNKGPRESFASTKIANRSTFQFAAAYTAGLLFSMGPETLENVLDVFLGLKDRMSTIDLAEIYGRISNMAIANWFSDLQAQESWEGINTMLWGYLTELDDDQKLQGYHSLADYVDSAKLYGLRYNLDSLLIPIYYLLGKDYDEYNQDVVGTLGYNVMRILTNHYPEVTHAWLRSYDSFYDNETAMVTMDPGALSAPSAVAVEVTHANGKTDTYAGTQLTGAISVKPDDLVRLVPSAAAERDTGEAFYYQFTTGKTSVQGVHAFYDVFRLNKMQADYADGDTFKLKVVVAHHGQKLAPVTITLKLDADATVYVPESYGSSGYQYRGVSLTAGKSTELRFVKPNTTDQFNFKAWKVYASEDGAKGSEISPDRYAACFGADFNAYEENTTVTNLAGVSALFEPTFELVIDQFTVTFSGDTGTGLPSDAAWKTPDGKTVETALPVAWAEEGDGDSKAWKAQFTITLPEGTVLAEKESLKVLWEGLNAYGNVIDIANEPVLEEIIGTGQRLRFVVRFAPVTPDPVTVSVPTSYGDSQSGTYQEFTLEHGESMTIGGFSDTPDTFRFREWKVYRYEDGKQGDAIPAEDYAAYFGAGFNPSSATTTVTDLKDISARFVPAYDRVISAIDVTFSGEETGQSVLGLPSKIDWAETADTAGGSGLNIYWLPKNVNGEQYFRGSFKVRLSDGEILSENLIVNWYNADAYSAKIDTTSLQLTGTSRIGTLWTVRFTVKPAPAVPDAIFSVPDAYSGGYTYTSSAVPEGWSITLPSVPPTPGTYRFKEWTVYEFENGTQGAAISAEDYAAYFGKSFDPNEEKTTVTNLTGKSARFVPIYEKVILGIDVTFSGTAGTGLPAQIKWIEHGTTGTGSSSAVDWVYHVEADTVCYQGRFVISPDEGEVFAENLSVADWIGLDTYDAVIQPATLVLESITFSGRTATVIVSVKPQPAAPPTPPVSSETFSAPTSYSGAQSNTYSDFTLGRGESRTIGGFSDTPGTLRFKLWKVYAYDGGTQGSEITDDFEAYFGAGFNAGSETTTVTNLTGKSARFVPTYEKVIQGLDLTFSGADGNDLPAKVAWKETGGTSGQTDLSVTWVKRTDKDTAKEYYEGSFTITLGADEVLAENAAVADDGSLSAYSSVMAPATFVGKSITASGKTATVIVTVDAVASAVPAIPDAIFSVPDTYSGGYTYKSYTVSGGWGMTLPSVPPTDGTYRFKEWTVYTFDGTTAGGLISPNNYAAYFGEAFDSKEEETTIANLTGVSAQFVPTYERVISSIDVTFSGTNTAGLPAQIAWKETGGSAEHSGVSVSWALRTERDTAKQYYEGQFTATLDDGEEFAEALTVNWGSLASYSVVIVPDSLVQINIVVSGKTATIVVRVTPTAAPTPVAPCSATVLVFDQNLNQDVETHVFYSTGETVWIAAPAVEAMAFVAWDDGVTDPIREVKNGATMRAYYCPIVSVVNVMFDKPLTAGETMPGLDAAKGLTVKIENIWRIDNPKLDWIQPDETAAYRTVYTAHISVDQNDLWGTNLNDEAGGSVELTGTFVFAGSVTVNVDGAGESSVTTYLTENGLDVIFPETGRQRIVSFADVNITVSHGSSAEEIRAALQKEAVYARLEDGSLIQVPAQWLTVGQFDPGETEAQTVSASGELGTAVSDDYEVDENAELTATVTILAADRTSAPKATPGSGSYEGEQNIKLTADAGAAIFYAIVVTDNGAEVPDQPAAGAYQTYTGPITLTALDQTTYLFAYAAKAGLRNSETVRFAYQLEAAAERTAAPEATPGSGSYVGMQKIRLTADEGASIFYALAVTKNGAASPDQPAADAYRAYTGPITLTALDKTTYLFAYATKEGFAQSETVQFVYLLKSSDDPKPVQPDEPADGSIRIYGDDRSVSVSVNVTVKDGAASISGADMDQIDRVLEAVRIGCLHIDAAGLDGVGTVVIPAAMADKLADAAADAEKDMSGVEVILPAGSVKLDAAALKKAAESGGALSVTVRQNDNSTVTIDALAGGKRIETSVKAVLTAAQTGQVLVAVEADGSERVIKKSLIEDGRVYAVIAAGTTVRVADKAKAFPDVKNTAWYDDEVAFVSSHELFQGTDKGFEPGTTMSRAMLATVLHRLEDAPAAGNNIFDDVAGGAWYADAVAWANSVGIVQGTDRGFEPDKPVTREQIAVMLYRYAKLIGLDTADRTELGGFTDSGDTSDWAKEAMRWAVSAGLFRGNDDGSLNPKGNATRAEVAALLMRMVGLIVK